MFGSIGGAELILVLVLALLLFGPRKLPAIGRTVGAALSEFRKATRDFKTSLEREVELDELRGADRDVRSTVRDLRASIDPRGPMKVEPPARRPAPPGTNERRESPEDVPLPQRSPEAVPTSAPSSAAAASGDPPTTRGPVEPKTPAVGPAGSDEGPETGGED